MTKYQIYYDKLIARAKNRVIDSYTEKHHIIPKCMGGSNKRENLVNLTAREHFIAHQLLVKINPSNSKLIFAVKAMCMYSSQNGEHRVNNRMYGWLRKKFVESISGSNHHQYRKPLTDQQKLNLSNYAKNRKWSNEHKDNLSKKFSGNKNPRAKLIEIYDSNHTLIYTVEGNFLKFCIEYDLPGQMLKKSYIAGGIPLYQSKSSISKLKGKNNERWEKYAGWYALDRGLLKK